MPGWRSHHALDLDEFEVGELRSVDAFAFVCVDAFDEDGPHRLAEKVWQSASQVEGSGEAIGGMIDVYGDSVVLACFVVDLSRNEEEWMGDVGE